MKFTLFSLLALALPTATLSVKCGQWYSSDCIADEDPRYDADASNAIIDQDPIWSKMTGFHMHTGRLYDATGLPTVPTHSDPADTADPVAMPYESFDRRVFTNFTVMDSRAYLNMYFLLPPARQEFCDEAVPEGKKNVIGAPQIVQCGVNGHNYVQSGYYTSTYERDGSLTTVVPSTTKKVERVEVEVANEKTVIFTIPHKKGFEVRTWVSLDDSFTTSAQTNELYYVDETTGKTTLAQRSYETLEKVSEADWVADIRKLWIDFNVPMGVRIGNGELPLSSECLVNDCPTEQDWCMSDPECSTSPYSEPSATVKAGPIAGIVCGVFALIVGGMILYFRRVMQQQKARYRAAFAQRIAQDIDIGKGGMTLTPEALQAEFAKIDSGAGDDAGDGVISKEELWTFISSGKAGEMSRKDFNALFAAMDIDHSGTVDFMEFCNFMTMCNKDLQAQASSGNVGGAVDNDSAKESTSDEEGGKDTAPDAEVVDEPAKAEDQA